MSPMQKIKKNKRKISSILVMLILVATCLITYTVIKTETVGAATSDFTYYINLTINTSQISGSHSYMPCLVYNESITALNGLGSDDFTFFDVDGNELDWELVNYNDTSNHLEAWVNVSSVDSGTATWIHLWYEDTADSGDSDGGENNPTNVWDTNYRAVWHFTGDSYSDIVDSTSNYNNATGDGTDNDGPHYNETGHIGNCTRFDGGASDSGDWLDFGDPDSLSFLNGVDEDDPMTIEAWIYIVNYDDTRTLCGKYAAHKEYQVQLLSSYTRLYIVHETSEAGNANGSTALPTGSWQFITYTYGGVGDPEFRKMLNYLNGTKETMGLGEVTSAYNEMSAGATNFNIGRRTDGNNYFNGYIDELHISGENRSQNYIKTKYNMMNNLTDFWIWGAEVQGTESNCELIMLGGTNYNFTLQGEISQTVYANSSGTYYETGEFNFTIYATSYFEFLRINISDLTDGVIDCPDMYLSFDDDNSSWSGNWYQCTGDADTIWVNGSEWTANNYMSGTNPFSGDNDADGETEIQSQKSIFMRVRIDIPADATLITHSKTDMTWDAGEYA